MIQLLELSEQLKNKAAELAFQKEKAEESTRLKSQFLASMSHELAHTNEFNFRSNRINFR
jgi:signal transduction histidine kinase